MAAKDHGTKFRGRLAASFSGIVHCGAKLRAAFILEGIEF